MVKCKDCKNCIHESVCAIKSEYTMLSTCLDKCTIKNKDGFLMTLDNFQVDVIVDCPHRVEAVDTTIYSAESCCVASDNSTKLASVNS